jgi:NAD(P)H-dependent FMN reductase
MGNSEHGTLPGSDEGRPSALPSGGSPVGKWRTIDTCHGLAGSFSSREGRMTILAICGSLQAESGNMALLRTAGALVPPGVDLVIFDGLRELPHFNPDLEASGVPGSVTRWRQALAASDAVLIASPEYGFSLPGVLKNGIDWVIGSGELEQKVVAITAAVAGPPRGRRGLEALRGTLSAVRATIVGGGEPIARGPGLEPQVAALLRALLDAAAADRGSALALAE